MSAVVWSKNGCMFCEWAKELLADYSIEYEERNISQGEWTREQLQEAAPGTKTVPQIFLDGKYVGGFTELKAYMKNQEAK
jgi:glutaredoxin 3